MKFFKALIILVLLLLSAPLFATSDQFKISQQTINAADVVAPTVPTALTATAVSSSQINLAWASSTDNVMVAGYRVYRNAVFIATTTDLFYYDTALSANTLYSYYIEAFDPTFNISSSTAVASATTFPAPQNSGGSRRNVSNADSSPSAAPLVLLDYFLVPKEGGTIITVDTKTNHFVQAHISWGLTPDYELGKISSLVYEQYKQIALENLLPGTKYFVLIALEDGYGQTIVKQNLTVVTEEIFTPSRIANVTNLRATRNDFSVILSWNNPAEYDAIRIVRNTKTYPRDISDGEIVYEGRGQSFTDSDVGKSETYFYTVFVRGADGSYSTGVIISSTPTGLPVTPEIAPSVPAIIGELTLADFIFNQNGERILVPENIVHARANEPLSVYLANETIENYPVAVSLGIVSNVNPRIVDSFLMRMNDAKTGREAAVPPYNISKNMEFTIMVTDVGGRELRKISGIFAFIVPESDKMSNNFVDFVFIWAQNNISTVVVAGVVLMLPWLLWLGLRLRKRI